MGKKNHDESRRDFIKKALRGSFLVSAGLFLGSKDMLAKVIGEGSGVCSTSYSCSGGSGQCGTSYSCSGGGGACGTSYDCAGQGSRGKGQCGTSYSCSGGGGACGTAYDCSGS